MLSSPAKLRPANSTTKNATLQVHIVIIGAGMAGTRFAFNLAQAMRDNQLPHYQITLLNSEPYAGYNRIMLSPVLAGEKDFADLALYADEDYADHHITLRTHATVSDIDLDQQLLTIEQVQNKAGDAVPETFTSSSTLNYDKLVFATGSTPFILPLPNHNAKGVFAFRTKMDVDAMLAIAKRQGSRCVVIGGGLLGLEAANALSNHGAQVTVVHIGDYVLERQLDANAARLLQTHFEHKGIKFCLTAFSDSIEVNEAHEVTGLRLKDGQVIDTDCIIMTVGVRPNIALAKQAGVPCDRGILVDEYMQTQCPDVYAIGECVQFDTHLFGLVAPVYAQADVLSQHLIYQIQRAAQASHADATSHSTTGSAIGSSIKNDTKNSTNHPSLTKPAPFEMSANATKLKVSGVNLFSAGDIVAIENTDSAQSSIEFLRYDDSSQCIYQKLSIQDNRLIGAVLYGDVTEGSWFFELIQNQTDISSYRDDLLFGQAFCQLATNQASKQVSGL